MARSKPRKQTRQIACVALFSALMLLFGGPAFAKEKVVTLSEVTIVGRVQKPIAAVGVSKIQPKLTLSELKQSFADRIERALYHSPF
ncbi:MAG: hypothetical protein MK135_09940 [Polyangiaceae bacterium]|nr:hypothetical protein [Polyangiaceae bacterium]